MEKIQIKNVRSLKDTTEITLSPITLLVGENSSGKSTFLRLFPLIKQSISKRTDGPLLWAGDVDDYVDFGSFAETVTNDGSKDMTFCFSFSAGMQPLYYSPVTKAFQKLIQSQSRNQMEYSITIAQNDAHEYISRLNVMINKSQFDFALLPSPFTGEVAVDDHPICSITKVSDKQQRSNYYNMAFVKSEIFGYYLPTIVEKIEELFQKFNKGQPMLPEKDEYGIFRYPNSYMIDIVRLIGQCLCGGISWDKIKKTAKIRGSSTVDGYWNLIINQLDEMAAEELQQTFQVLKLIYFYSYFHHIEGYLDTYFRQVHYIAPLRATAERYYRLRNLAIDEVDYQGKNLAIFLSGLPKNRIAEFQSWTQKYFGFHVDVEKSVGHLSIQIALDGVGAPVNMSDTGFGYSQILPIITQIWDLSTRPRQWIYSQSENVPLVIAIEQPELHLHPALQAKLVRALIASIRLAEDNGYHLQLLIETHSETIINYLGRAIARGGLSEKDVSVILFDKNIQTRHAEVRTSKYSSDGYLTDWPIGFLSPKDW